MARRKFSKPGDLVFIAPSYAKDRPWLRKWVGTAGIVVEQHQDNPSTRPGVGVDYYVVLIGDWQYILDVSEVQLEPVQPVQNGL